MALTATTLAGAMDAFTNIANVTSATSVTAGQMARINNELVKIQGVNGTVVTVFRGIRGTKAEAHKALSDFVHGPQADFPAEQFPLDGSYTYSASGAMTVAPGIHKFAGTGALTMTLAAPSAAQEGLQLVCLDTDADGEAHTITAAFGTGTTATFDGTAGSSITLVSADSKWFVLYANGVTIS